MRKFSPKRRLAPSATAPSLLQFLNSCGKATPSSCGNWVSRHAPGSTGKGRPGPGLVKLIVRARALRDKLINGDGSRLGKVAEREGVSGSYFTRLVRLAFLSPDITKAILDDRHALDLTAAKLMEASRLPLDWQQQRKTLGFA